ncbi:hypothetical protein [Nocardia harenae]|uniref:hypothetical protein n=1 Tax=Nocardia harenae TaxID=358707 RepID=UPI0012ECE8AD|nr:hypothetical protein [Nocardia harenae]
MAELDPIADSERAWIASGQLDPGLLPGRRPPGQFGAPASSAIMALLASALRRS